MRIAFLNGTSVAGTPTDAPLCVILLSRQAKVVEFGAIMGLCKCPKRRVTNLFCFVHRVNVCEDCIISQHHRCIVRSYLQWLQDSDFEPLCLLCSQTLDEGEVVRLACHDIFHIPCLDNYVTSRPAGSTPGSLTCPQCKERFFPSPSQVSPIVDRLRLMLRSYRWGREGLGIQEPSKEEYGDDDDDDEILTSSMVGDDYNHHLTSTPRTAYTRSTADTAPVNTSHVSLELYDERPVNRGVANPAVSASATSSTVQLRDYPQWSSPLMVSAGKPNPPPQHDTDSNKYRRKNPLEGVTRWFRQQQQWRSPTDNTSAVFRRYLLLIVLACAVGVLLIVFMTRVGRSMADSDPALNLKFSPLVRTGD